MTTDDPTLHTDAQPPPQLGDCVGLAEPLEADGRIYHQGAIATLYAHGRADLRDPDDADAAPFAHVVLTDDGARLPTVEEHYAHRGLAMPAPTTDDEDVTAPETPHALHDNDDTEGQA